jgi:hypothetical protein
LTIMENTEVEVWAHKSSSTKFTVPNGTRPEIENAIAERLRSEILWEDDPVGINVQVILNNKPLSIRRRFKTDAVDRPLLIEDKSEAVPTDGRES